MGPLLGLSILAAAVGHPAPEGLHPASRSPAPFTDGSVHELALEVTPEALRQLREQPRRFVRGTMRSNSETWLEVAVRLKGSTGSYRGLEDKPAFTLDFARYCPGQRFRGRSRIYLNNSVEDPSLLNEWLGAGLFRAAGIPAPQLAHARVRLNGRCLGLYVLKEGFTREFLAAHFARNDGSLYDNDLGCDVDQRMHRNLGTGEEVDQGALRAAAAAAAEPDLSQRWAALERTLDLDEFITFIALEAMLGHRDGYGCGRNNFRIYSDPDTGRLVFLPDGLDQLFGLPEFPWCPRMAGLLARAVLETPEGRRRYRERFEGLLKCVFVVARLDCRVDEVVEGMRPGLTASEFQEMAREAAALKLRIAARRLNLERQLGEAEPRALVFRGRQASLPEWWRTDEASAEEMAEGEGPDGRSVLRIVAAARTSAAWRTRVLLEPGRYRFEGAVQVTGVRPLGFGRQRGAGLRVGGAVSTAERLTGDTGWRRLATEFAVGEASQEVELLCELRASGGQMWVDRQSLRLVRLSPGDT